MNLLGNKQTDEFREKILFTLAQTGLNEEETTVAKKFFDFSAEMNLSLLDNLKTRKLAVGRNERSSIMLFNEMLRMPKDKSLEFTDRYILFLDAVAGNTAGCFLFSNDYSFYDTYSELTRIRHAYELKYPKEEIEPRLLAFSSYGMNINKTFSNKMLTAAKENPKDFYKAVSYCIPDEKGYALLRLSALALAFRKEGDFTDKELKIMEECLLNAIEAQSVHYTKILDFTVIMLFMALSYGSEIKKRVTNRLKLNYKDILPSLIRYIPHEIFESHMDFLADASAFSDVISTENIIKLTISSAVICDALNYPSASEQSQNSTAFLAFIAKKYPEDFISAMTSGEALDRGYCFDYFDELKEILLKAVPDAEKLYSIDSEKIITELASHKEVIGAKPAVRKQVLDYLKGNSDIDIFNDILSDIIIKNNSYSNNQHESNMLTQLKKYPDFYNRYVSYKILSNLGCFRYHFRNMFIYNTQSVSDEIKSIFTAAIKENVSLSNRIMLFEIIYSDNDYFDERKKIITDSIVEIMEENTEKYDCEYEKECLSHQIYTCCCYIRYLEKTNTDNKNKNRLLALSGESSKEIRRTLVDSLSKHKEYETDIIEMLSAKKLSVRETAVDVISFWGVEHYRDILTKTAETEKSSKLADKIRSLLGASVSVSNNGDSLFSPLAFVEDIHKGGRVKKISWLFDMPMPEVHFKSGALADEKYLQAIILCYSTMQIPGRNGNAFLLANELNENELNNYAAEIFNRWYSAGAESKSKWALYFSVIHGGQEMTDTALKCIKDWSENMRGAIAAEAVKAISLNGSAYALMTVDNLAHKFKQKQVKKAASEAMESAADILGITADELGDRIVPNLGFNENMERIFDYGERKFTVCLSTRLDLEVFDENSKKLKTLPAPGKKDNEEIAKQSNTEFKALKKQLKNVITIQKLRLETALLADRRWTKSAWEDLFVKNPVMHCFAIGLIWAAYYENECTTFRYMEDGTFNTSDEDEFILPDECSIGLVHPIDLDEELISSWKEQLSDYEIVQPIVQMEKPVYRLKDDEYGKLDLERFNGKTINALTLMGRATKLGWIKGSTQDAGLFYTFYREDVTSKSKNSDGNFTLSGNAVELHFSGTYVAVENEEVTIENIRFYHPGTIQHGSYVYDEADDEKAILLEKIPPRYFSEIVLQLEEIIK